MTEADESLLTAAKLAEVVDGDLDDDPRLGKMIGVAPDAHRTRLDWLDRSIDPSGDNVWRTALGEQMEHKAATEAADDALHSQQDAVLAYLVGITDRDLYGSELRLSLMIAEHIRNDGAPSFVTAYGNPNTGKTNTVSLLVEMAKELYPKAVVLSNVREWEGVDVVASSMHDLAVEALRHREQGTIVVLDELSTHFDARTCRREVATQYTPLAKRYAKIGVRFEAGICHTGKDLHPERKRLNTMALHKEDKKTAEFFETWPADADAPDDPLFAGEVKDLEPTGWDYDPDDAAPWSWNLRDGLFQDDLTWPELLAELVAQGPADAE